MIEDRTIKDLLTLLWQLPAVTARDDITKCCQMFPERADAILHRRQRPNMVLFDPTAKKKILVNDFNKVADAYRSPGSSTWLKEDSSIAGQDNVPAADRKFHAENIELECLLNGKLDLLRETRCPRGISSGYIWTDSNLSIKDANTNFGIAILVQNSIQEGETTFKWDAIHAMHIHLSVSKSRVVTCSYYLKSTIYLTLESLDEDLGKMSWSAHTVNLLEKQRLEKAETGTLVDSNLDDVLLFIEESENKVILRMRDVLMPTTMRLVSSLRLTDGYQRRQQRTYMEHINQAIVRTPSHLLSRELSSETHTPMETATTQD